MKRWPNFGIRTVWLILKTRPTKFYCHLIPKPDGSQFATITLLLSLLWGGLGCGLSQVVTTPTAISTVPLIGPPPTPEISVTATGDAAAPPSPSPTPIPPDTGWLTHQPGLEQRTINLFDTTGQRRETVTILRLDPAYFTFDIGYHPGQPQTLAQWQAETGAHLVVNGGYFTEEKIATGLIIVDGVASGWSYEGFGGMVVITEVGLAVRSLVEHPIRRRRASRPRYNLFLCSLNRAVSRASPKKIFAPRGAQ